MDGIRTRAAIVAASVVLLAGFSGCADSAANQRTPANSDAETTEVLSVDNGTIQFCSGGQFGLEVGNTETIDVCSSAACRIVYELADPRGFQIHQFEPVGNAVLVITIRFGGDPTATEGEDRRVDRKTAFQRALLVPL